MFSDSEPKWMADLRIRADRIEEQNPEKLGMQRSSYTHL